MSFAKHQTTITFNLNLVNLLVETTGFQYVLAPFTHVPSNSSSRRIQDSSQLGLRRFCLCETSNARRLKQTGRPKDLLWEAVPKPKLYRGASR